LNNQELPEKVVQILLAVNDKLTERFYIYALADDLVSILRSDDYGISWTVVSQTEYTMVTNYR